MIADCHWPMFADCNWPFGDNRLPESFLNPLFKWSLSLARTVSVGDNSSKSSLMEPLSCVHTHWYCFALNHM